MAHSIPNALLRAALVAALLCPTTLPAAAQGLAVTWLDGDAALEARLPSPTVRLRVRAGNRVWGGDHELAIEGAGPAPTATGQRAWSPSQSVPFRVSWDGLRRVTLSVGGQVLARDVPAGFSCLALRAASMHRGAGVAVQQLDLNHAWLGVGPRVRSLDGQPDVEAVLVQGGDLGSGFVLRGLLRLSWIQPPPLGDGMLLEVLLGEPAELGQDYCVATPNSAGTACDLSWSGVPSLSTGSLWLHADGGVPDAVCLFLTSPAAQAQPLGNGWLCVGPPVERLGEFGAFDASGRVSLAVPLDEGPLATLEAGELRNFQLWYRDAKGFPEAHNLSDALALLFVP
jgi:hypothetical protein